MINFVGSTGLFLRTVPRTKLMNSFKLQDILNKYLLGGFCALLFCQAFSYAGPTFLPVKESCISVIERDTTRVKERFRRSAKDSVVNEDDSLSIQVFPQDSLSLDSLSSDSLSGTKKKSPIEDIISSTNKDSLVYDVKTGEIRMYTEGKVEYQDKRLEAEYIEMKLNEDRIRAFGAPDSVGKYKQPRFTEGTSVYDMDSIVYNLKSEKAKLYGMKFSEGEGILRGRDIKKMDDDVFNIRGGKFTTCNAEHPHFYLAMTKAQYVQGKKNKKLIVAPSDLVFEDVPLPLGIPFAFFPIMGSSHSGIIMPEVGEENLKGFFLRGGGYYFKFNDYVDLAARAGIYTMGSWEASLESTYKVRYKYSGDFRFNYSKDIIGSRGSADYQNMSKYRLQWTHSQDPKFRPGSTLSANVNFSSSNYNKYDADNINDYISSQTNSSIAYSKTWAGTPFSFSTNIQHSQSNRDSTIMLSLPNFTFNVSRVYPFRRKNPVGKQKWYEQISFSYTNSFSNSVTTKQKDFMKSEMFKNMKYGMRHELPVNTSFTLLKYLNISPSFRYTERWYFDRINKAWDPMKNQQVVTDTTHGFYRVYDYSFSASLSTRIYGMFEFKGKNPAVKAIRHVLTPSISGSYTPDFGDPKYGFYRAIQTNASGDMGYYSPYENGVYGLPSRGRSASLSFSLGNTLEMKARSKTDSTGYKIVKLLESLTISSSYNFLADSLKLSPFSINARTTLFKSMGINLSARFDPYALDSEGNKINRFAIKDGKLGRFTSIGFSFGYSFRSVFGLDGGTGSDALPPQPNAQEQEFFDRNDIDYAQQQQMMASRYYDFSVPWNLSFNYTFNYSKPGLAANITQTLGFQGSVNLTPKWGINFNGGFDFQSRKLTPGSIALTRDLHCWQMDFSWVPIGFRKSWSFTIRAKSGMLSDLKYKKSSGYLDNMYNYY